MHTALLLITAQILQPPLLHAVQPLIPTPLAAAPLLLACPCTRPCTTQSVQALQAHSQPPCTIHSQHDTQCQLHPSCGHSQAAQREQAAQLAGPAKPEDQAQQALQAPQSPGGTSTSLVPAAEAPREAADPFGLDSLLQPAE